MTISDPISDMLTRMRNAIMREKDQVRMPASTKKRSILAVMKKEGYINDFYDVEDSKHPEIEVSLKYYNGKSVISELKRISKPGLRVYSGSKDIPMTRVGLGITIVSTSQGVMTDTEAREKNIGGEVIAGVF